MDYQDAFRRRTTRVLVVLLGMVVAACGGGDKDSPASSSEIVLSPGSLDPAVRSACDVGDSLLARAPGTTRTRAGAIPFDSAWVDPAGRSACRVAAIGHVPGEFAIIDSLLAWLGTRGWDTRTTISADGPDGTVQGLRRGGVTCVVEGRWDGGDDSDPAYMPSDSIEVRFTCAALVAGDTTAP